MSRIHPTAVIDPQAQLGEDVEVGPYCVIEGPVRIGAGTVLRPHVTLLGDTVVGEPQRDLHPARCSARRRRT